MVVYATTVTIVSSTRTRLVVIAVLLGAALVHVLISVIQFSRGNNFMPFPFLQRADYGERGSGFYVCPNHLAGLLEVVGIFGLSLCVWGRWGLWQKLLVSYATVACYVGIALSGSRGGYLSAAASLFVFGALSLAALRSARVKDWWRFGAIAIIGLLLCGSVSVIVIQRSGYLRQRAGMLIDTGNMRVELWRAALTQWRLQPMLGTGSGTYQFYGRQFRRKEVQNDPVDVHNDYLHLLCEYGILGAAAFLAFIIPHIWQAWRSVARLARRNIGNLPISNRFALTLAALASVGAYLVHSAFDFNLHVPANALLLSFVFGLIANVGGGSRSSDIHPTSIKYLSYATPALALLLVIQAVRLSLGEYYAEKSRIALRDEKPRDALQLAAEALDYESRNPNIFFSIGRASLAVAHQSEDSVESARSYQNALAAFIKARSLAPLDGTYPLELAMTYDSLGRFDEAEHMYSLAKERDPMSINLSHFYATHRRLQCSNP